jgi:transposase
MGNNTRPPHGGNGRDWSAYNSAQVNEKEHFQKLLRELCREVTNPKYKTGCPPFQLDEMAFCLIYKIYSTLSSRRYQSDLREAEAKGLIRAAPSANTLSEYMRSESMTSVLQLLLTKSSLPLAGIEKVFAADSTGFGTPGWHFWFNKHKGRREKRRAFIKLHVMIGVVSNVITCAEPSEGSASDRTLLKHLVEGTARYFEISEVSADAGYLSAENFRTVLLAGGVPYIAFYKNCAVDGNYKSAFWKDLLFLQKTRHPTFTDHYYLRNNVEATFSSIKAKFGGRLRSKSQRGQFNEALCKALCHNLCVLIKSMYDLGIDPTSWSEVKPRPEAEGGLTGAGLERREKELAEIRIAAAGRENYAPEWEEGTASSDQIKPRAKGTRRRAARRPKR